MSIIVIYAKNSYNNYNACMHGALSGVDSLKCYEFMHDKHFFSSQCNTNVYHLTPELYRGTSLIRTPFTGPIDVSTFRGPII